MKKAVLTIFPCNSLSSSFLVAASREPEVCSNSSVFEFWRQKHSPFVLCRKPPIFYLFDKRDFDAKLFRDFFCLHKPFEPVENKVKGFVLNAQLCFSKLIWPQSRSGWFRCKLFWNAQVFRKFPNLG